ncbi:MAG TPA: hypothetical protein VFT47_10560 [Vicinamibacterales bacterium]|nr:hypothetical protein [Vicinamibacterales bacterium]
MTTLTRTLLTTGAMLIGVAAVAAQAPGPSTRARGTPERVEGGPRKAFLVREVRSGGFAGPMSSPDAVIERLESFDANRDHRISREELPERMQALVARGDRNADAALDFEEIRSLATAASSGRVSFSFRSEPSEGLPGVVNDLKLPAAKHEHALAIVSRHKLPRNVNEATSSGLFPEMKALLDDEEYENFVAATARLSRRPPVIIK